MEKAGGEWKLLSEGPAADDVAAALLEAKTDTAREEVLAAETEIGGGEVVSSLGRIAGAAAMRNDYRRAQEVYEAAVLVARRGGLKRGRGRRRCRTSPMRSTSRTSFRKPSPRSNSG